MIIKKPKTIVTNYKKPKRKTLGWVLLSAAIFIVGIGFWVGSVVMRSINEITADSGKKASIFSIFERPETINGQLEGRTNILLLGNGGAKHPGGGLTDTIMVISIDWPNKKMAMISVPRDLWVKLPNGAYSKINYAYFQGNQNPKITGGGGKIASDVVGQVLGLPIHYYLSLDFDGFKKIVDSLGGVDIYIDKLLYDPYYPADNMIDYSPLKITPGMHHMDGSLALKYARSRETTSDFDRSRRQQQVISAVKEKVLSLETLSSPKKITELLSILGDHLRTNLSVGEIRTFWDGIKEIDTENMINKVFDTAPGSVLTATQDERGYIIYPKKGIGNYSDLQKIAQNIFSQTPSAEQQPELKLEVLNATGKTGIASQFAQLLKSYGYNVIKIGNYSNIQKETYIFNCVGSKGQEIAENLANTLKATVKTKSYCANIDIQIVLGQNNL